MQPMAVVLPAPFGPNKTKDFARLRGERDALHGSQLTIGLTQLFDFKHSSRSGEPAASSTFA
jgi:hypothetical protein